MIVKDDFLLHTIAMNPIEQTKESFLPETMNGDSLREIIPIQIWLPFGIHMVRLQDRILHIAPLHSLNDLQIDRFLQAVQRCGVVVEDIEIELMDRTELNEILQKDYERSADHCEKTLLAWLEHNNIDGQRKDNDYAQQFKENMIFEALKMRASQIILYSDTQENQNGTVKYLVHGQILSAYFLPDRLMKTLLAIVGQDDHTMTIKWHGRSITVQVETQKLPPPYTGERKILHLFDPARIPEWQEILALYGETSPDIAAAAKDLFCSDKGKGGIYVLSAPSRDCLHLIAGSVKRALGEQAPEIVFLNMEQADNLLLEKRKNCIYAIEAGSMREALQVMDIQSSDIAGGVHIRTIGVSCPHCRLPRPAGDSLSAEQRQMIGVSEDKLLSFHNDLGCEICFYLGVVDILFCPSFALETAYEAERGKGEGGTNIVFYDDRAMIQNEIIKGRLDPIAGSGFLI